MSESLFQFLFIMYVFLIGMVYGLAYHYGWSLVVCMPVAVVLLFAARAILSVHMSRRKFQ